MSKRVRNRGGAGTVKGDMGSHRWLRERSGRRGVRPALALGLSLVILSVGATMSACATPVPGTPAAGDTDGTSATTGGAGSTGTTPQPSGSTREEDPGDMTDPQLPGIEKTLRGTVSDGVEANCILLTADDGKSYLLIGGDRQVIMGGGRLEVTGQIQPDLMTTCQQGTPFTVSTVRKI